MKTLENTMTQEVKDNSTRELNAKAKNVAKEDIKADSKTETKPVVKKETKPRAESNEALGERLLKEKASQEQILKEFSAVYKSKAGVTDKVFVAARAMIYMKIAKKRAEAKTAAKKN